jgi:membrane glycosyltransferase
MTGSRQSATRLPRVQPPLQRGAMVPRPWAGHPLRRWFRFLADPSIGGPSDPLPAVSRRAPAPLRRLLLLVLVLTGALAGGQTMLDVLPQHGRTPLEGAIVLLFGILFAWISAGFWTAVMGAWVLTFGDRRSLSRALRDPALRDAPIPQEARTAVVMPICNEHVATVFAGLRATWESLQSTGQGAHFDFFVLSDSNDPDARADEMQAWTALNAELAQANGGEGPRIHYRWRALRTKRKAGNVADFCRRWGKGYRYMVVLDADSVMTGDSLTTLVRLMEAHPDAGIIQTAPKACGYDTLHARIQQFGSRVYAPLFTAGMHYWQLGESHYWGHNAILRVEPFMTHCALAPLPGRGSLSGEILSHDFVEAALMRRAGWKVWIAWDLDGSYEQLPPDLLTEVQRDRRWCQGNLQNSRLMFEPGLHPVHRAVFLTGTLSYLSAPLWLGFLLLSSALFMAQANTDPQYFLEPYQLFPIWPGAERNLVLALFGATAALLFAPKVLAILLLILRGRAGRFGGVVRLVLGALVETLHSIALAPVRMMFHTQFVFAALTGWRIDWRSPPREATSTPWSQALRRHGPHAVFAAAWVAVLLSLAPVFPWWLSPVLGALLVAIPLSVWTSRAGPGRFLARLGILSTPEEREVPAVLARAHALQACAPAPQGFVTTVTQPEAVARTICAIPTQSQGSALKAACAADLVHRAAVRGPASLSKEERLRLLSNGWMLSALQQRLAAGTAHADWVRAGAGFVSHDAPAGFPAAAPAPAFPG